MNITEPGVSFVAWTTSEAASWPRRGDAGHVQEYDHSSESVLCHIRAGVNGAEAEIREFLLV